MVDIQYEMTGVDYGTVRTDRVGHLEASGRSTGASRGTMSFVVKTYGRSEEPEPPTITLGKLYLLRSIPGTDYVVRTT